MIGRSLTSRFVLVIAVVTSVSVLMVGVAVTWSSYDIGRSDLTRESLLVAVLFGLTTVALASLVAWRLGRALSRPVVIMARTMRRMAEGDLEVKVPRAHPATELGDMAQALEAFRTNARERLEAEAGRRAAEKTAQDRSDFLAVMSHEIRTPMNGVLGMADALTRTPMNADQRQMLSVLTASGATLLSLLNDVLDFSKIESGRFEIERIDFDARSLVHDVCALFGGEAQQGGLTLSLAMADDLGPLRGDPSRIRQVLHNLLGNAVKFTRSGGVGVEVDARPLDDGAVAFRATVRDTGIGISPEVQARLFQKFVQGDPSSTRAYGGTGLGLALSRELARLMGGDIVVDSRPGEGSVFTVTLRLEPALVPIPDAVAEPAVQAGAARTTPLRILAAEDNPNNRKVLQILLDMLEADATFAIDGAEAVALWEGGRFDAVLMDVQMPEMDGLTATRRIRERERAEGLARTPILAVTANAMSHHVAECLSAGMDGHVSKPIRAAELFEALTRALQPTVEVDGAARAA